jgi:hypothetical protein
MDDIKVPSWLRRKIEEARNKVEKRCTFTR